MPERANWTPSASVPVELPVAPSVCSMPASSAVSTSSSKTFGERVAPRKITGPGAERVGAQLLLVDPRGVGGVGDVDDHCEVGLDREGRGAGAEEADLLLHGGDRGEARAQRVALVAAAQRLQRDVGAEAVVHRAGDQAVAGQVHRLARDHDRVADPDQLGRLLAVGGADVDVQPFQLDDLLARFGVEQVQRLAPGDTPSTGPSRPCTSTRCPTRICGSQPPIGANQRKPFSSMWRTTSPISSMWPTTASRGEASPIRATEEPIPSAESEAKEASSRQSVGGGCLVPGGGGNAQELVE